ncbi:DNA/RNA non-specific endonuclease [Glaciihabitans sp. UYNi722]|uniref:DNA/RNA non-specific endonuclease n=1 Tax=Glaciihabitans sp. UYNi722 TaxID=3156344 RepID=UPI0033917573
MATSPDGYAADFLPIDVALPSPATAQVVRELTYTHFTVLLDPERRFAVSTGVNIDGSMPREIDRTDDWHLDPRVPATEQAAEDVYRSNDLDRGHLVRRRDPVWGDKAIAAKANEETFVYTNAAPQVGDFNQGKELWSGLEDFVLAYARAYRQRISVFTAPVLTLDDPPYRGILIPRQFWKIAAWTTDDGSVLAASGYLLDQTPQLNDIDLAEARARAAGAGDPPPLGPYRTYQVPVSDVAELTGLKLGQLVAADRFATAAVPHGTTDGDHPGWIRLKGREDIVL